DRVVRCASARAAGFEQRGMEPAAMLVGAFEIDVRRPLEVRPVLEREGMRGAGIEPDVEDVPDLRPAVLVVAAFQEPLLGAFRKPGISAFLLEGVKNAGVDHLVLENFAILIDEYADGNAPGTLARKHPVGPLLDHGAKARLAGGGHEAGFVNGL